MGAGRHKEIPDCNNLSLLQEVSLRRKPPPEDSSCEQTVSIYERTGNLRLQFCADSTPSRAPSCSHSLMEVSEVTRLLQHTAQKTYICCCSTQAVQDCAVMTPVVAVKMIFKTASRGTCAFSCVLEVTVTPLLLRKPVANVKTSLLGNGWSL